MRSLFNGIMDLIIIRYSTLRFSWTERCPWRVWGLWYRLYTWVISGGGIQCDVNYTSTHRSGCDLVIDWVPTSGILVYMLTVRCLVFALFLEISLKCTRHHIYLYLDLFIIILSRGSNIFDILTMIFLFLASLPKYVYFYIINISHHKYDSF